MKKETFANWKVSESVLRLNPDLFGVGSVEHPKRESHRGSEGEDRKLEVLPKSMAIRVDIISFRKRLVDQHDNLRTGAKPLVDNIASRFGIADCDPRIEWNYHQIKSSGQPGTAVKIEIHEQPI